MRTYLFLQGPHGSFFRELGLALQRAGHRVLRVNICGGDVVDWHSREAVWYQGRTTDWSGWIGDLMRREGVTDLLAFGDWRPLHREAILVAKLRNIRVWAFEEGYLRPHYITMEEGGVNGNSMLPHSPALLRELAESHPAPPSPVAVQNPLSARVWKAIAYYAGTIFLRPFFPCFRTHRPQSAVSEVWGWFLRVLTRRTWERRSAESVREIYRSRAPYFLFPLQLDSDSQVRRYSPFSGMKEAIAHVLTSFAHSAPKSMHLLIRNHPLDNGLINYRRYIRRFSHACGLEGRVHFVESGRAALMMDRSEGMVVLNSTIGISGLQRGIPVYCVGTSIYAVAGRAGSGRFLEQPAEAVPRNPAAFRESFEMPDPHQRQFLYGGRGAPGDPGGHGTHCLRCRCVIPVLFYPQGSVVSPSESAAGMSSTAQGQGCGREFLAAGVIVCPLSSRSWFRWPPPRK